MSSSSPNPPTAFFPVRDRDRRACSGHVLDVLVSLVRLRASGGLKLPSTGLARRHRDNREETIPVRHDVLDMADQLIIQGLPEIDEVELHEYICRRRAGDALRSCVVIKDRDTKRCRGFGFLKFHDSEAASRFREEWRDGGLELDGYPLRVDHSRDHANDAGSWTCDNSDCRAFNFPRREVCYKCDRPRAENDFTKDMGTLPSQFLQLRDLHPSTNPQHIVSAITRLQDVQVRRLLLLEGRENEHVPVAFVEFQDSNAAARALALAANLPGKGFLVKGKPVRLSFIHVGVFVPVYGTVEPGVFCATNSNQLLAYWNPDYRCSVHIPENAISEHETAEQSKKRKEEYEYGKRKKVKALGSGVTIKSGSGGMISHWSKRQDELNGQESKTQTPKPPQPARPVSFADSKLMACLLCSRKFKSLGELEQHESQSDLHQTNLSNPDLLAKAEGRVRARNPAAQRESTRSDSPEAPPDNTGGLEYRDRALERRIQIKQSGEHLERPTARHKKRQQGDRLTSPPASSKPEGNAGGGRGSQLMSKMGYVSGGLGSSGQGRAEIVRADTYLSGVGLGSAGAKLSETEAEARRSASGPSSSYSDFVASVKERARTRYAETAAVPEQK